jgi:hypothetical protein
MVSPLEYELEYASAYWLEFQLASQSVSLLAC